MGFKKGQSGNPKGRPQGSQDKRTALRELLQPHAPKLVQQAVNLALEGDTTALRMCLDRIIPPMPAESPAVEVKAKPDDLAQAGQAILSEAFAGKISPSVAQQLLRSLQTQSQITEVHDLLKRLEALEERLAHTPRGGE